MSLLDKMKRAMEKKEESVSEDVSSEQIKNKRTYTRRALPKQDKLVVPEHIKNLFNDLDKSVSSVWGMQEDGKIKWVAKYKLWEIFRLWFKELI